MGRQILHLMLWLMGLRLLMWRCKYKLFVEFPKILNLIFTLLHSLWPLWLGRRLLLQNNMMRWNNNMRLLGSILNLNTRW
jgi:hypothetical protein